MKTLRQLYSEWQSLQPLSEENQTRLDRKFNLEFNYNSNHLEGNTLTYGQTELLLMFGETSGNANLRDYEEMKAHDVALKIIREEAADHSRPLTEKLIRDLNELILVKPFYKDAETTDGSPSRIKIEIGSYKTRPNHVRTATGETFHYAKPEETPAMMTALVDWFNRQEASAKLHPLELASLLHYRFIRIHPFDDGNGRIARLLVNYVLLRHDYPMIVIKSDSKDDYLRALHGADLSVGLTPSDGANAALSQIGPFVDYMKAQMEYSLRLSIRAARGESLDEPGDLDKKLKLLKREMKTSEEVQMKFSPEAVQTMMGNAVIPLMQAWERSLKEFDPLVFERTAFLGFEAHRGYNTDSFDKIINKLTEQLTDFSDRVFSTPNPSILMTMSARGIINLDDSVGLGEEGVEFNFFSHAYKISTSANDKVLTKMYHQVLTDGEISEIVEALGSKLLESIERHRN